MKNGALAALAAYTLWGLLPIYWKLVERAPAAEILSHRAVWAVVVVLILLAVQRQWGWVGRIARKPAILAPFVASTILLAANWLIYLWANNNGNIVEVSLGYFINPLFSVFLGVLLLHERLRPGQWTAIALALAGVTYLTVSYGHPPWIALSLALTFGFYGLMRKKAPLGSVEGLTIEMSLMFLPSLVYLGYLAARGTGTFGSAGLPTSLLLAGAGLATAIPLILFAKGARSVPLSTMGILQYTAPTLQFLIGVVIFREAFSHTQAIGFTIIWAALLLYWLEGMVSRRRQVVAAI
jgi:chloramphenicol-sensitive protein RarD